MNINVDLEFQFLNMLCSDPTSFTKAKNIIKPEYFCDEVKPAVESVVEYYEKYGGIPDTKTLKSITGVDLGEYQTLKSDQKEWLIDNYEQFAKKAAMRLAVIESSRYINTDMDYILKVVGEANKVGIHRDMGLNYQEDPKARLEAIKARSGNVSNGYEGIDLVAGKANYGDLIIFAGGSGTGKSLFLQNIAINYYKSGKNVMYITLELHPELCARRMDAMNLNVSTDELYNKLDLYSAKIRKEQGTGSMNIHYMPSGSKTSEIKAYIEDYMLEMGIQLDAIFIDYLDLVDPMTKVSTGDTFNKDKHVSEELRNMFQALNIVGFTASQLNREAVQQDELHHGHIAGGLSKINTADLVLGIIIDNARREKGIYELQVLKNRNGTGTGKKIRLKFISDTMKIYDDDEFIEDIDIYSKAGKTSLSSTEKTFNKVQNALNTDNKAYTPVEEDTGEEVGHQAKVPPEIRSQAAYSKLAGLDALISDDDD